MSDDSESSCNNTRKRRLIEEDERNGEAKGKVMKEEDEAFGRFCQALNISSQVSQRASDVWLDLRKNEEFKGDSECWYVCMIYIAAIDLSHPYGLQDPQVQNGTLTLPSITVTDLLRHGSMNVPGFFKKMRIVREYYTLTDVASQHLVSLERKYCVVCPLYVKFEKIFDDVFLKEETEYNLVSAQYSETDGYHFKKKLCWTLFVYAKTELLNGNQELVVAFHMLLGCIDFVINSTPSFQLKPPFDMMQREGRVTLINLCIMYHADITEVQSLCSRALQPFLEGLPHSAGITDLWQVMDAYTEIYRRHGDIDELLFLSREGHLLPNMKSTVTSDGGRSVLQFPPTPISMAMNTVQQLHTMLSLASDETSPTLLAYFKECAIDATPSIMERVEKMRQVFVTHFKSAMGESHEEMGNHRFTLAVRLYYRVMEALLRQEEKRLLKSDFSHLLHNSIFNKSLLSCAVVVVMASYANHWDKSIHSQLLNLAQHRTDMEFPWVLEVFNLQAYDFYKVIESFIRAEPKLTKEIVKHLQNVENQILESISWQSSSCLYKVLSTSEVPRPTSKVPSTPEGPKTTTELFQSPMDPLTIPAAPNALVESPKPKRSQSLNLFFNKVCRLAYHRLQTLCNLLYIPKDLQHRIWTCLEHCITHEYHLLKDRHLDQMIMCSLYAICKVQEKEIKFKMIVSVYRDLPHASLEVYKYVMMNVDQARSTIIDFYNAIFMPAMKNYILQFADTSQTPSMSPVPKSVASSLPASPVYRLPGRNNFFISPMKDSPFKPPLTPSRMTPRTRQLYSFGEGVGSAEKLRTINEIMRAAKPGLTPTRSRTQKCLSFDLPEEEAASGVTKEVSAFKLSKPTSCKCLSFTLIDDKDGTSDSASLPPLTRDAETETTETGDQSAEKNNGDLFSQPAMSKTGDPVMEQSVDVLT